MREIIIEKQDKVKTIMLLENGILIEKYEENEDYKRLEGNIYIRKSTKYFTRYASSFYRYWT